MKAMVIHEHGGPEVLHLEDRDLPAIGPDQILIRVQAAGINPADHKHRIGMFRHVVDYVFPLTIGYDVAGTVEAVGAAVDGWRSGDRVFAMLDPAVGGGYAEFVTTNPASCGRMPPGMAFDLAAALPCAALTGLQLVEEWLRPKSGDRVLITGATGMVGRFALHAAKAAGAVVVAGVRSGYREEALALGADEAVTMDGSAWGGPPFDGVIDTVGGAFATALAAGVHPGRPILTVATDPLDAGRLPSSPEFVGVRPDGDRLTRLARQVMTGGPSIPIAARLPLRDAGKAQALVEQGRLRGKVVLLVGAQAAGDA